jgi:apolipoprotein D and lipocalin family protein
MNRLAMVAVLAVLPLFALANVALGRVDPPKTVDRLDLNRYMGQWYEIAAMPIDSERRCVGGTTAEYSQLPDGTIRVLNQCRTGPHETVSAEGRARLADAKTNARLDVTFVNLGHWWWYFVGGEYWVLDVDENYQYALVGDPYHRYAWILSRTPKLSDDLLYRAVVELKKQGYNPCLLMTTPQDGGMQTVQPFCKVT